ncbi:uncharacterized protein LOC123545656 [Mercenaria mercenaria]|uniref:uncharacterized protein LOC123545656 n=1 Tax=Mercenaria mercenaria TaxID=6596 RepID=UPI00234ECEA6|nr:uncharacterized protein LOC123545656 [Mercenaria mercenaria]
MDIKDSDELKEIYCESCYRDELKGSCADGFCVNCVEYLCATCIRYHKKHLADHVLHNKSNMPQEICYEHCELHPNEPIKFYCDSCDVFACSSCNVKMHIRHAVQPSYRLSSEFETSEEFKLLNEQLNEAEKDAANLRRRLEANAISCAESKQNLETSLVEQKDKLIASFDIFKTDINRCVDKLEKDNENKIQAQLRDVSLIESNIMSVKTTLRKATHGYKLFMETKKSKQVMKPLRLKIADMKGCIGITEYSYEPRDVTPNGQFGFIKIDGQKHFISPVTAESDVKTATETRFCQVLNRIQKLLLIFAMLLWAFTVPYGMLLLVKILLCAVIITSLLYFGSTDLSFVAVCKCVIKFVFDATAVIFLLIISGFLVNHIYINRWNLYTTYTEIFEMS